MEYTFDNITDIVENSSIKGYSCVVEEKPLPILQDVFDEIKREYIRARNISTEIFISDYGEEEGMEIMNNRYPKPVNIDELANQAKIIANKYEICGTTLIGNNPGFIVKMPNVRVRVRTYCNLGDYYCWIQKYGIDKFELKIYQAMPNEEGYLIFGGASYPHPHIAGHGPCLGSFESVIRNCAGHFNMVGVLSNIKTYLNSYYGRSVYLRHSEFRPIKVQSLPIELLKEYPGVALNWGSYYEHAFKDEPLLRPELNDDEYRLASKSFDENWYNKRESVEIKPHEANFYGSTYGWPSDCPTYYGEMLNKVRLVEHKFDVQFYQAYAMLMTHANQLGGNAISFDSKHTEHQKAWDEINAICINQNGLYFRIGYGDALRLRPDESLNSAGQLEARAMDIYRLIYPGDNSAIYKLKGMRCNDFWKYIDNYKSIEEFLIPQDDYDERKKETIELIDILYPEVMAYKDAFSRKILITLDKHKRRLQNGLKHTKPTPESNQLSFETLSQD